jgi:predicted RNA-binding protein with PUA-like domain
MAKPATQFWLMKTEPDAYSIDRLEKEGRGTWDGVRNPIARNHMRAMNEGDLVLFYHSSCKPPGVVGIARVCRTAYPDHTSWDPTSKYFDEKSSPEKPRWDMVDVEFVERTPRMVTLDDLKADPSLEGMIVTRVGRLSVQPVSREHFARVLRMAKAKTKLPKR